MALTVAMLIPFVSTMIILVMLSSNSLPANTCQTRNYLPLNSNCDVFGPGFCPPSSVCDDSTSPKACRLPVGKRGCGTAAVHCVGSSICENNTCIPSCPDQFTELCGRCLHLAGTLKNQSEGVTYCSDLFNSRLVVTKTQTDLNCVLDFIADTGQNSSEPWLWLGTEWRNGQHVWLDGTPIADNDSLWETHEPSNVDSEPCVDAYIPQRRIHDYECYYYERVVCEKP